MLDSRPIHCGFTCGDAERTLAFLCNVLGFERLSFGPPAIPGVLQQIVGIAGADARIGYARLGTLTLELLEYTAPDDREARPLRPCDTGFAHVAVGVGDINATIAAAAIFGFHPVAPVVTVPAGPNLGQLVVYLRDAGGFTVELMSGP